MANRALEGFRGPLHSTPWLMTGCPEIVARVAVVVRHPEAIGGSVAAHPCTLREHLRK